MTLQKAREILGKEAKELSDDEISRDIEAATILKDLFFHRFLSSNKQQ